MSLHLKCFRWKKIELDTQIMFPDFFPIRYMSVVYAKNYRKRFLCVANIL